ncbi:SH3 domain-containing protein [Streptomyces sp. NPDC059037]|uniref:SH3 domain-containing protein n=1 Tax=Streptomyces sp. NPDC059037 TaxID=3346710 RepID=UPI0036964C04
MGKFKGLRVLAAAGVMAVGLGLVGASAASAVPFPGPDGANESSAGSDSRYERGEIARATVDGLRVRSGPGTNRAVLGLLYEGDRVRLVGKKQDDTGQDWYRVTLRHRSGGGLPGGFQGWVTGSYLY